MKIAIVAPSPVPFGIGGIENLVWGMSDWINQNTKHQVELIKLPSREMDFWSLIETYYYFYKLNLDYFDMVISVKYPAWMVKHKNHVCYLAHRLRGLYDTYHFTRLPKTTKRGHKKIDEILDYMKYNSDINQLDDFFNMLFSLKGECHNIPQEYFSFPGSFIREIIHFLDNNALSNKNIKKFLCISDTVKNRKEYFPKDCDAVTIYPPSNLKKYSHGEYNHIFMVSRLDGPKRINLLIESMCYVKSDIKLFIAGTGPQEEELKRLAGNDKRIEFLGFVNDDDVEKYYRDSLVVPYFPYDEDYGLITIEAMMHGKPVITTIDAGGPTEFVINNETGFVVGTNPKEIAEKIDYFAQNTDEAKRMGINAFNRVNKITWDKVVSGILNGNYTNKNEKKKKITVTSTFPIYPPLGGGQSRIYNIYRNLGEAYDVEIVSLTNEINGRFQGYISNGLYENRISKSNIHCEKEWEIESKVGVPITDVAMPLLINYTPEYINELQKSIDKSDLVVISHPYMWTAAKPYLHGRKFIYEAHNVEYNMKKKMLPSNKHSEELISLTYNIEKECCEQSKFIMTCSEEDRIELARLYNVSIEKIIVVPNGVDTSKTAFVSVEERLYNKQKNGLEKEKIGLFMGSWHGPNLEACEQIFKIAPKCKDTKFLLMGSQCEYFKNKRIPDNVGLLGIVSEETKNKIFGMVDFALNPMLSGSGTNLKMFDYMSAGIPVITTELGTRGIENKNVFIIANTEHMADEINKFCLNQYILLTKNSREYVENTFNWRNICDKIVEKI